MQTILYRFFPLLLLLLLGRVPAKAQMPTARSLFERMKKSIDTIQTISYALEYRNVNGGEADSIFWSFSKTWAKMVPADTIFGAHIHVQQQNKNGVADYYYDGVNALDIYHQHHKNKALARQIIVIEPYWLGNGDNSVQARTTARGYCEELLSPVINARWAKYLDSMQVSESKKEWVLQWRHSIPEDGFYADMEVVIGKQNNLITQIKQYAMWNGVPMTQTTNISNIQINLPADLDSITLRQNFPHYKVTYQTQKSRSVKTAGGSALVGTKAKPFRYATLGKTNATLTAPKDGYLLLDFWETWCGYCFVAMPKLEKLYRQYHQKGLQLVSVVTENKLQVEKLLEAKPFTYPTVFANAEVISLYRLSGRPRYILIDDTGKIVADGTANLEQLEQMISDKLK